MSHIARIRSTAIKNPNLEILSQVANIVAQQHEGGLVLDHYFTYQRARRTPTTKLAIRTKVLHRGVGLSIDRETGSLVFVGDPYGANEEWQAVINEVQQTYIGMVAVLAYQQLGWVAEIQEGEEGALVVVGSGAANG